MLPTVLFPTVPRVTTHAAARQTIALPVTAGRLADEVRTLLGALEADHAALRAPGARQTLVDIRLDVRVDRARLEGMVRTLDAVGRDARTVVGTADDAVVAQWLVERVELVDTARRERARAGAPVAVPSDARPMAVSR